MLAFLELHTLYFLPVINMDGHKIISDVFDEVGKFPYVRKNQRDVGCEID